MKNVHMPYTVFQVMKVFLIERHKIKVPVLLFLVELHQLLNHQTQIFTALKSRKFPSQTYLKGFVKFTIQSIHQAYHPNCLRLKTAELDKNVLLMLPYVTP